MLYACPATGTLDHKSVWRGQSQRSQDVKPSLLSRVDIGGRVEHPVLAAIVQFLQSALGRKPTSLLEDTPVVAHSKLQPDFVETYEQV